MIKIRRRDDVYEIRMAGGNFKKDRERILALPVREAIWVDTGDGIEKCDRWEVPREDISEIIRRFPEDTISATKSFWKDVEEYEFWNTPLEELEPEDDSDFDFKREPFPYQRFVICLPSERSRTMATFDCGLGKTYTGLERFRFLGHKSLLIISLNSIDTDWMSEIREILGVEAFDYRGTKRKREDLLIDIVEASSRATTEKPLVVWTTYNMAAELPPAIFDHFIFDEAHSIKGIETQRYQNLVPLIKSTWREPGIGVQVLTATPLGNSIDEMWVCFHLIHPFLAGTRRAFERRFRRIIETKEQIARFIKPDGSVSYRVINKPSKIATQNKNDLIKRISSSAAGAKDVKVPYVHDERVKIIQMTPTQREFYEELRAGTLKEFRDVVVNLDDARSRFTRLRQATEGLFNFPEINCDESGKLDWIIETFERAIEHARRHPGSNKSKMVGWSCFKPIGIKLQKMFPEHMVVYNGDLNKNQKKLAKWAFNGVKDKVELEEYLKLLAKYPDFPFKEPGTALGMWGVIHNTTSIGMNLQSAGIQIYSSLSTSGYAMHQTIGRLLRMSTKHKVIRSRYLCAGSSWEPKLFKYVMRKREEIVRTVKGEEALSREAIGDLIRILQGLPTDD